MARPVEIDRKQAFEVAFQTFWRRGYRSTSLQLLLDEMDIGKSSFYAAFTSKEVLFRDVLAYYWSETQAIFSRIRLKHRGLNAVRAFLKITFLDVSGEELARGCLAVNSTLELAGVDEELHNRASQVLSDLETELRSLLFEAQSDGELQSDQSPQKLARMLIVMLQGLKVESRRGMSRAQARVATDTLMELITQP